MLACLFLALRGYGMTTGFYVPRNDAQKNRPDSYQDGFLFSLL